MTLQQQSLPVFYLVKRIKIQKMALLVSSWSNNVETDDIMPPEERPGKFVAVCKDNIPVIDLGLAADDVDQQHLVQKILKAMQEFGIFQKNSDDEIESNLDGRSIYLIGMMGSGKSTIGKILSELFGYSFFDSDKLIEHSFGGTRVADIFHVYGESFFRDIESEELRKLSSKPRLVVSTGGGSVLRASNWKYMQKGIVVCLDVPLEVLARRITEEGTHSRPLVHQGYGDAYQRTLARLFTLWEERREAYNSANVRVSLEDIAAKRGYKDVCSITPTKIALEAILQIEAFLKKQGDTTPKPLIF